ncbi:MAG: biotin--[acetyl-CoA-carboxylase] ligase [Verrucomicrobiota bacterium]
MSSARYDAVIRGWSTDLVRVFPEERFIFREETGSTNDDLLKLVREGEAEHLTTVVTDHQSKGRGRRGDKWEAPPATNLLVSVALRLPEEREVWTRLPHLVARVLGGVVESILPGEMKVQTKWPNDLFIEGKKVGGILVETVLSDVPFAVVGMGLNVNMRTADLPDELQPISSSLYEVLGCESSRSFLLGLILQGFIFSFPSGLHEFESVRDWLETRSFLSGKKIKIITSHETILGRGIGLGQNGELRVELELGEVREVISSEKIELC